MSGKPHRIADNAAGRWIDRSRRVAFSFDGWALAGHAGDSLASALLANGRRLMGRSFKYHRPRSVVGLGAEEMNALVGVGEGNRHEPNLRATMVELHDGLVAVSQNRWPSLEFDIGAASGRLSRLFPAGFYYKTFMWPQAFWKGLYEPLIRRAAGLGRAARGRDPDSYEHVHVHCDVLVVGAGAAGLAAAEAAASGGAKVIIADESARFGGVADLSGCTIDGAAPQEWTASKARLLAAAENVHVLSRTTVLAHFHHNYVLMAERVTDHDPLLAAAGLPRQRLWKVRARRIVLAAGAIERPIVFANNDRPGVMLAQAVRGYVERYGVAPGERGVIFTNNDDAYRTALVLKAANVAVSAVVDVRTNAEGPLIDAARQAGITISRGAVISGVETSTRDLGIERVKVAPYRSGRGRITQETRIACDFVAVSGGFNPAVHLWCHNGGKPHLRRGAANLPARSASRRNDRRGRRQRNVRARRRDPRGPCGRGSSSEGGAAQGAAAEGEGAERFGAEPVAARGDLVRAGGRTRQRGQQAFRGLPERRDGRRPRACAARRI